MSLRELSMNEAVSEAQFTGPSRTVFPEGLRKWLIQQGPGMGLLWLC